MRKSWKVLLAATLGFSMMCGAVLAAGEPVFTGCICFDPTNPFSRQSARNTCDDDVINFAGNYRAGILRPEDGRECPDSCDEKETPPPLEQWSCFGVGGLLN